MRVLINTIPFYGKTPGLRTYTVGLLSALHASDADMEWHVVLTPADMERLGLSADRRFRSVAASLTTRLSTPPGIRFLWRNTTDQVVLPALGTRYDLMHYLDSYGPLLSPGAGPIALTIHDLLPLHRDRYFAWWAQTYLAMLMRATIPRAQALLAVSAHTADELAATFGVPRERISTVPNGIDARFRPQSQDERRRVAQQYSLPADYVIYVGSINPRKNVARLVQAFTRVRRERNVPHHMLLVGTLGWQYDDVVAAMREADAVRYLGHVPDDDIAPLIAGAACLAYPSLEEGFGLPVIEAMACGTPVLTSSSASLPEVAGGAALLVEPRSESNIAEGLAHMLTDSQLRAHLRDAGLTRAKHFTWAKVAAAVIEVYRRMGQPPRNMATSPMRGVLCER